MSRTKRRLGKDVDPRRIKGYTYTDKYVSVYRGRKFSKWSGKFYDDYGHMPVKQFPLPENEYWKGYWYYHGDNYHFGHNKRFRSDWSAVRSKNRDNLIHFVKGETEDCFFWEDVNTQDWD